MENWGSPFGKKEQAKSSLDLRYASQRPGLSRFRNDRSALAAVAKLVEFVLCTKRSLFPVSGQGTNPGFELDPP